MLVALVCLQVQSSTLTKQPKTVDVVTYHQVLHSLPSGAPDPVAPDNFFMRETTHYHLLADSDWAQPDQNGTRNFLIPGKKFEGHEWYEETSKAPKALDSAFKYISEPYSRADFKKHKTSWGSSEDQTQPINKCSHCVAYECITTTDEVETHTLGKKRVTRIKHRDAWSLAMNLVGAGTYYDPIHSMCTGLSDARVDPPVYGY